MAPAEDLRHLLETIEVIHRNHLQRILIDIFQARVDVVVDDLVNEGNGRLVMPRDQVRDQRRLLKSLMQKWMTIGEDKTTALQAMLSRQVRIVRLSQTTTST